MIDKFFDYAKARYQLMLDKEADFERPWTNDPILAEYRFCNVFREDDTTTKWIREHITHEAYGERLLVAMVIARWFNRIGTLELLLPEQNGKAWKLDDNLFYNWQNIEVWKQAMRERLEGVAPLVTGAYMIKTPAKMNKLEGLLWCIGYLIEMYRKEIEADGAEFPSTLEDATNWLAQSPYLGPFMAYEVITDLRHTPLLGKAPDIMTWANPGPGAARGLARVYNLPLYHFKRHKADDVASMNERMRKILKHSTRPAFWPKRWPKWEMRDVEHTLCEFDKYERARLGQGRPKQKYKMNGQ